MQKQVVNQCLFLSRENREICYMALKVKYLIFYTNKFALKKLRNKIIQTKKAPILKLIKNQREKILANGRKNF